VDQTKERTRGAIAGIIVVAIAIAAVGVYAASKPPSGTAYLRPNHAIVFYAIAVVVLVVGLLVVLAASAGTRGRAEG
jgi:hypothetical protein